MPKAAPINPDLIRAIFAYDPATGHLIPNKLGAKPASLTSRNPRQWLVGVHRYREHRLVWAWHHPDDPNPYSVQFIDENPNNSRIDNLRPIATNPRWLGHVKQAKVHLDSYGRVVDPKAPALPPPNVPVRPRASELLNPKPVTSTSPTFDPEEFEAMADELARTIPQVKPTPARLTPTPPPVRPNTAAMYDPDFDPWEGMYE